MSGAGLVLTSDGRAYEGRIEVRFGTLVTCDGRERHRRGANRREIHYGKPAVRTWPIHRVREIRWA
jgi:hypothetical protein